VVFDTSPARRDARSAFLAMISDCSVAMLLSSFGIVRWRKEGLVVGASMRASARACVCRWVDIKDPIWGRWESREFHWDVASRSLVEERES